MLLLVFHQLESDLVSRLRCVIFICDVVAELLDLVFGAALRRLQVSRDLVLHEHDLLVIGRHESYDFFSKFLEELLDVDKVVDSNQLLLFQDFYSLRDRDRLVVPL